MAKRKTVSFVVQPGGQSLKGHPIVIDGVELVVHRVVASGGHNVYRVSEPGCGRKLTISHWTAAEAIAEAASVVERAGGGALVALRGFMTQADDEWPPDANALDGATGGLLPCARRVRHPDALLWGGPLDAPNCIPRGSTERAYGRDWSHAMR